MTANRLKKRAMDATVTIMVIAAVFHFGHHAILGEFGRYAQRDVNKEIVALQVEKSELAAEKARLDNLAKRLSPGYLDLDLLDEQARAVLGYVREDEVVLR